MITTKIHIKPHLAEYIKGKYNDCDDSPITLPHDGDLYVAVWDLMATRPVNAPRDTGNVEIVLPSRSVGKRPEQYNYLSERSVRIIEKKIEDLMFEEIHAKLRANKRKGITYLETIFYFMNEYQITAITEDAFKKDYYRMRQNDLNRKKQKK